MFFSWRRGRRTAPPGDPAQYAVLQPEGQAVATAELGERDAGRQHVQRHVDAIALQALLHRRGGHDHRVERVALPARAGTRAWPFSQPAGRKGA